MGANSHVIENNHVTDQAFRALKAIDLVLFGVLNAFESLMNWIFGFITGIMHSVQKCPYPVVDQDCLIAIITIFHGNKIVNNNKNNCKTFFPTFME